MDGDSFHLVPIRLAQHVSAEDFETFMLEDVFPAIPKESLRTGQVTGLRLIRGNNSGEQGNENDYLWLIYGTINGGAAINQLDRLSAFGAEVRAEGVNAGDYREVGRWSANE